MKLRLSDVFPPFWSTTDRWNVEYTFEQKPEALDEDFPSVLPEILDKRVEVWQYSLAGKEIIDGKEFIVITVEPEQLLNDDMQVNTFVMYIDKESYTLHSFKREQEPLVGDTRITYVKNPWGEQSLFLADHHHLIFDWPSFGSKEVKEVGIGNVAFVQKHIMEENGVAVEMTNKISDVIMAFARGKPWWIFADKVIKEPGKIIHIQAKLLEQQTKQAPPIIIHPEHTPKKTIASQESLSMPKKDVVETGYIG